MDNSLRVPTSVYVRMTATSLLMNYIKLVAGVPVRLHFTDDYMVERTIMDRDTGKPKKVKSLVLWVDRVGGEPDARTLSILSQKLAAHLEPFLKDKEYTHYDFIITKMGDEYYTDFNVQPIRLAE